MKSEQWNGSFTDDGGLLTQGAILDVTAELLASGGYDSLQLRDVARIARVSLSTIYKHFPSRDELIVAALNRWMATHLLTPPALPEPNAPLHGSLMEAFRNIFAPWERTPTMLAVFLRANLLPDHEPLAASTDAAFRRWWVDCFDGYDPQFVEDVSTVLTHLTYGLLAQFATGRLDVAGIVRVYERAVYRLTIDARKQRVPRRKALASRS